MRSVLLYDPKVYSIILARTDPGSKKKMLRSMKSVVSSLGEIDLDMSTKGKWTVIELMTKASPPDKDYVETSPEELKLKYEALKDASRVLTESMSAFMMEGSRPHIYSIMACGSRDNVWLKTSSDMTFLYKEKRTEHSEILQTNISYLNRLMTGKGEVFVNSLKNGKVGASLYILGRGEQGTLHSFPRDMVLEINNADINTRDTYGEGPISVAGSTPYGSTDGSEKRIYQTRQNYLINLLAFKSKLLELFLLQANFMDMRETYLKIVTEKGQRLKEDIYQLQNDINEHMKRYIPGDVKKKRKSKEKDFLERQTFEQEKQLLKTASVRFSLVSEVEHQIMRHSSLLHDMEQDTREAVKTLSMEVEDLTMEGVSYSLGDITLREVDTRKRELKTLMEELSHSRDILSSTIEVLRTFIDTRQREVSEDMSRLMNLLFLVFACIGLADALGNFVIMVLENGYLSDSSSLAEVFRFSSLGMILTLLPLLTAAIFLYLFFKKK